jgi:hypothetical protein
MIKSVGIDSSPRLADPRGARFLPDYKPLACLRLNRTARFMHEPVHLGRNLHRRILRRKI